MEKAKIKYEEKTPMYQDARSLLNRLEKGNTNIDESSNLEYNVDGCSCISCGCFKNAWTVILSPAGIAAGLAAFSASSLSDLGS
jgi:hypothetical protein